MKLKCCHIVNFGGLSDFSYEFNNNLNEFCHPNGWGKSTFACFIKSMFYGLEGYKSTYKDYPERKKYFPFNGGRFGGSIEFTLDKDEYRIERFFDKKSESKDECVVYKNNSPFYDWGDNIGLNVFNIDKETFSKIAFISHKQIIDFSSINILKDNDNSASDDSFDKVIEMLSQEDKRFKALRGKNDIISSYTNQLANLSSEIANANSVKKSLPQKYCQLNDINDKIDIALDEEKQQNKKDILKQKWANVADKQARLDGAIQEKEKLNEKYKKGFPSDFEIMQLNDNIKESISLKSQIENNVFSSADMVELENKYNGVPPTTTQMERVKSDLVEFDQNSQKIDSLSAEQSYSQKVKHRNKYFLLVMSIISMVLVLALTCFLRVAMYIKSIVLAVEGGIFLALILAIVVHYKKNILSSGSQDLLALQEKNKAVYDRLNAFFNCDKVNWWKEYYNREKDSLIYNKLYNDRQNFDLAVQEKKMKLDSVNKIVDEFFSRFSITKKDELLSLVNVIVGDKNNYDNLCSQINALSREIEKYKQDNDLTTPPLEIEQDYSATLRELYNDRSSLINSISQDEQQVKEGEEKKIAYDNLHSELEKANHKHYVLSTTIDMLLLAQENLKNKYISPLQKTFNEYLALVNSKLDITLTKDLQPTFIGEGSVREGAHLSEGQKSVVSLCMRLAFIDNILNKDNFIIMDDPFVHLDRENLENAKKVINILAKNRQILYFCPSNDRMVNIDD